MESCIPYLLHGLQNKYVGRRDVDSMLMIFTNPKLGKLKPQS